MKMLTAKRGVQAIILIVVFAATFGLVRQYRSGAIVDEGKELVSIDLEREAAEVNATLPEMVSEGVRLDEVTAGPGNSFNYRYTILDDDSVKDLSKKSEKLKELEVQLHERVCENMPDFRKNGTVVKYVLRDNAGKVLAEFSINPRDC
jgi:hypothetical protein